MAAKQGHAKAQHNLAVIYDNGQGVPQDDIVAVLWYRMAAEQGFTPAQCDLGVMYYSGEGVPQSNVDAYAWWAVAATNDNQSEASDKRAANNIKAVQAKMTPSQIEMGQRLAMEIRARIGK